MKGYKGDVTSLQAWDMLKNSKGGQLVDVRTNAEWHYVGTPDLRPIHKDVIMLQWRILPDMVINENFINDLSARLHTCNYQEFDPLIFICRTGGRSMEAGQYVSSFGYKNCFNLSDGFEGSLDSRGHRGRISGWKASGLSWRQD